MQQTYYVVFIIYLSYKNKDRLKYNNSRKVILVNGALYISLQWLHLC